MLSLTSRFLPGNKGSHARAHLSGLQLERNSRLKAMNLKGIVCVMPEQGIGSQNFRCLRAGKSHDKKSFSGAHSSKCHFGPYFGLSLPLLGISGHWRFVHNAAWVRRWGSNKFDWTLRSYRVGVSRRPESENGNPGGDHSPPPTATGSLSVKSSFVSAGTLTC